MKATILASLAAAALLSGAAFAADTSSSSSSGVTSGSGGTGQSTGSAMNTPGSSATTGTTTSSGSDQSASAGNVTQGTLISALNNTDAEIKELKQLSSLSASSVQVMSADQIMQGSSDPALKSAMDKSKSQSAQLQTEVQNNKAISDALKTSGASASDVIAVDVAKDGNVTVFTKPKS